MKETAASTLCGLRNDSTQTQQPTQIGENSRNHACFQYCTHISMYARAMSHHSSSPLARLGWAGVVACAMGCAQTEEARKASEGRAYTRSVTLTHTDPQAAKAACNEIQTHWLRDECLMLLTRERVRHDASIREVCDTLHASHQRDACWLEVADALASTADNSTDLCSKTGELKERCLVHAFQREASSHARQYGPGQEDAFFAWVQSRAPEMGVTDTHSQLAMRQTALLISQRRARGSTVAFSLQECGSANAETCTQSYRMAIRQGRSTTESIRRMCDGRLTAERARSAGFPPWSPDADEVAKAGWEGICSDLNRFDQ